MSVELANSIWSSMKAHISSIDRQEAADEMVSILVDHDYSPEEIKSEFKGDSYVRNAVSNYLNFGEDDDDSDEDEEEDTSGYYDEDEYSY